MQTKKRAKPVKFGVKEKKENPKEESVKEVIEKVDEEIKKIEKSKDKPGVLKDEENEPQAHSDAASEKPTVSHLDEEQDEESAPTVENESEAADPTINSDDEDSVTKENEEKIEDEETIENTDVEPEKETVLNKDVTFFNVPPDGYNKKKSMIPYFFTVMLVTFLLGLAFFAGIFYAVKNNGLKFPAVFNKPTQVTQSPPTVAPTPKPVDLSKYDIQILNGSGIAGEAAKLRTELTDAGFKVANVGNAARDNFVETEIAVSKKVEKEYLDKLKEAVSKSYLLGSTSSDASGGADVIITIGSSSAK